MVTITSASPPSPSPSPLSSPPQSSSSSFPPIGAADFVRRAQRYAVRQGSEKGEPASSAGRALRAARVKQCARMRAPSCVRTHGGARRPPRPGRAPPRARRRVRPRAEGRPPPPSVRCLRVQTRPPPQAPGAPSVRRVCVCEGARSVCVCVCARACVCARVCVGVCLCARVRGARNSKIAGGAGKGDEGDLSAYHTKPIRPTCQCII